jgi:broad specificity phosphatase PhoE
MRPPRGGAQGLAPAAAPQRVLYFVRHGQYSAQPNAQGGVLTELGRRQAGRLQHYFKGLAIDSVSSSDLPRAVQTAEVLAGDLGIARVRRHAVLREILPVAVPGVRVPFDKRALGKQQLDAVIARWFKRCTRAPSTRSSTCRRAGAARAEPDEPSAYFSRLETIGASILKLGAP